MLVCAWRPANTARHKTNYIKGYIIMTFRTLFLAATLALSALPASAGITIYTDQAAWQAALSGQQVITEDFEDSTLIDGLVFEPSLSPPSVHDGAMWTSVATWGGSLTSTWFNFESLGTPLVGFGGHFDLSDHRPGTGLQMYLVYDRTLVGGGMLDLEVPNTYTGQFFGFISTLPFEGVHMTTGTQTGEWIGKEGGDYIYGEAYHMNNLVIAVPEPSGGLMLLSGLLLLALTARKLPPCFRIAGLISYLIAHERRSIRTAKIFRTGAPLVGPDLRIPPAARN
ncbi:hypothetical protein [Duganella sp.]|uniref:hypothetical protein n=1 Tax=Duganella sp. TaxID=1904440 RepID=UPI0031D3BD8D